MEKFMYTIEQCAAEVGAAMAMPDEDALQVDTALNKLPETERVVGCMPGDNSGAEQIAGLLFREAYRRSGSDFLVAPWVIDQGEGEAALRGVALWPSTEATQNVINSV